MNLSVVCGINTVILIILYLLKYFYYITPDNFLIYSSVTFFIFMLVAIHALKKSQNYEFFRSNTYPKFLLLLIFILTAFVIAMFYDIDLLILYFKKLFGN